MEYVVFAVWADEMCGLLGVSCCNNKREIVISAVFAIVIVEMGVVSVVSSRNTNTLVKRDQTTTSTFCTE